MQMETIDYQRHFNSLPQPGKDILNHNWFMSAEKSALWKERD